MKLYNVDILLISATCAVSFQILGKGLGNRRRRNARRGRDHGSLGPLKLGDRLFICASIHTNLIALDISFDIGEADNGRPFSSFLVCGPKNVLRMVGWSHSLYLLSMKVIHRHT